LNRVSSMGGIKTYIRGCVSSDQIIPYKFNLFVFKKGVECAQEDVGNIVRAIGGYKRSVATSGFKLRFIVF